MDFMTALDIGASALSADRLSINVIAMNLANAKTTRTPEGGHYRRRTVIRAATDVDAPFSKHMQSALDRELKGVRILNVLPDARPPSAFTSRATPTRMKRAWSPTPTSTSWRK